EIGSDLDILYSRSTGDGLTWSAPAPVNVGATTDDQPDIWPDVATDRHRRWLVAWATQNAAVGPVVAHSTDLGATWSNPELINSDADSGNQHVQIASDAVVASDGTANWVAVWNKATVGDIFTNSTAPTSSCGRAAPKCGNGVRE